MRVEVMEHYGLAQPIDQAGYYETAHHKQLIKDIRGAIHEGRLIAVCGVVGSGKTVTLRRLQQRLREENKITVARSLSIEKHSIKLATLISALFYDLTQDKQVQIPKQGERRERELQELVKKGKRPVALFVDEAHDLNGHTLTGLKRLMEVVEDGGGRLSVVLAGHPKLRNDLRRPTMEEIGYRTDIFTLDGIAGSQREYIQWLLKTSMGKG
ncbi:AAA family ATPase, partial [Serratia fonticola]